MTEVKNQRTIFVNLPEIKSIDIEFKDITFTVPGHHRKGRPIILNLKITYIQRLKYIGNFLNSVTVKQNIFS